MTAATTLHSKRKPFGTRWYSDWNQTKSGRMPFPKETLLLFNKFMTWLKQRKAQRHKCKQLNRETKLGVYTLWEESKNQIPARAWTDHTAPVQISARTTPNAKYQLQTSTSSNSNSAAVSGVETNTVQLTLVQPCVLNANIAGKQAIFRECAWRND